MNIEFLNLLKPPQEGYQGRKEKNRGDEPIQVIIYMETSPCVAILNKQNSIYLFIYLFLHKQKSGRQNRTCLGWVLVGRRRI
jgi:hypothetical protein